jgi:excisionase family DNA binding protein
MTDRLLTGTEVAHLLNVSKALAYRLMAQGTIPAVHLGRAVRVRPQDLDEFIKRSSSSFEKLAPSIENPTQAKSTDQRV